MKDNILIIVPSLRLGGGAEKVATSIGTELYNLGYNVKYFTFYNAENKYDFSGEEFCLNEGQKGTIISKFIKLFKRAYKISVFCKRNNIKTCISFMEDANFPTIISKLFGNKRKIILSIHHSIGNYGKGAYYRLIKILYKLAHKIIVLTKYEKKNLINNFNIKEDKIEIIYNPIEINRVNKLMYEDLNEFNDLFENNNFTFISIGRLNKIKNQELLIRTFESFNKKYHETQLIILGEGDLKDKLKSIADSNKVYLLGNKKNVYKYLKKTDCFVLTSFSEAFPISILEAMACGLPIISSDTQGGKEIIGSSTYGLIFKNNNQKDLYKNMEKIYLNKKLREKYKEISLKKSKEFDIKEIIKKWKIII